MTGQNKHKITILNDKIRRLRLQLELQNLWPSEEHCGRELEHGSNRLLALQKPVFRTMLRVG